MRTQSVTLSHLGLKREGVRINKTNVDRLLCGHLPSLERAQWKRAALVRVVLHDMQAFTIDRDSNCRFQMLHPEAFD